MDAFVGEIKIWPVPRCPNDWHFCDGSLLTIQGNEALFSIIGVRYGGDGVKNFGLPDLRGKVPIHIGTGPATNNGQPGTNRVIGQSGGGTSVTLTEAQMPVHEHQVFASGITATVNTPGTNVLPGTGASGIAPYMLESATGKDYNFNPAGLSTAGNSAAHNNLMPSRTLNYIICTTGTYPTRP